MEVDTKLGCSPTRTSAIKNEIEYDELLAWERTRILNLPD